MAPWSAASIIGERVGNFPIDVLHRIQHALAEIALLVAVTQLHRLMFPVDAPLGTIARPVVPSAKCTSASTVGFPRESNTSRA